MSPRPTEVSEVTARILKCVLEVDNSRAYWHRRQGNTAPSDQQAFEEYWFGAKSLARVKVLLSSFQARFDAIPEALAVLGRWTHMEPGTRNLICHWHLQFSDAMYRRFTGDYLAQRRHGTRNHITRAPVIAWIGEQGAGRWSMGTRIELASKLMSCAYAAGLLGSKRDPRPLATPRVHDEALAYLMYLLRGVEFQGTLLDNPYVASVDLSGRLFENRLGRLPGLHLRRQGDLLDFGWQYPGLREWGDAFSTPSTGKTATTHGSEGDA